MPTAEFLDDGIYRFTIPFPICMRFPCGKTILEMVVWCRVLLFSHRGPSHRILHERNVMSLVFYICGANQARIACTIAQSNLFPRHLQRGFEPELRLLLELRVTGCRNIVYHGEGRSGPHLMSSGAPMLLAY